MTLLSRTILACSIFLIASCSENTLTHQYSKRPESTVIERQDLDFNFDWKFSQTENTAAFQVDFNDQDWRSLRLPHDWSIEKEYSQTLTAGATGYLPGGIGWYRKHFATPKGNGKTQILFDGVYNHSKVWINGNLLGERPYGYSPFFYDLTPYLNKNGKDNVIAVYVDRTRYVDSRWYTGSGIYRHVRLITTNQTHIPIWGNYITTPKVTHDKASISVATTINNETNMQRQLTLITEVISPKGEVVASTSTSTTLSANEQKVLTPTLQVNSPMLWDTDTPHLYRAKTSVYKEQTLVDTSSTRFGIRTLRNDAKLGFFLNNKNIKLKGVNLHHDAGLVGVAVPKGVWKRRLQRLKEAGVNAIRTSHNPPSAEFLDLCDEMGFLVQNEAFDEWDNPKDKRKNFAQKGTVDYITESYSKYFPEWAERDIKAMLMRDRNHPSIIQWSIGNEIEWTYPRYTSAVGYWHNDDTEKHNYYWDEPPRSIAEIKSAFDKSPVKGAELVNTAKKLSQWVKELDTTRPVTANLVIPSVSHLSGYTDALDIVGYSYRQTIYDYGHKHYPDKMIFGTENWVQWHEWKHVIERPFIPGMFVWTGIYYLGESNGAWPKKGSSSGMLDFAAFKQPIYHLMKSVWRDEAVLHITSQTTEKSLYKQDNDKIVEKTPGAWEKGKWGWRDVNEHWNYQENDTVIVEVYSNLEEVELFLNNKSLGTQYLSENPERIFKWLVPFEAGKLTAKAVINGNTIETSVNTANEPVAVKLITDKALLMNDGYDVAHIEAQLVDEHGIPVKHLDREIQFDITGDIKRLGVDNGSERNIQKHKSNKIVTHNGRALFIVQSNTNEGRATINASGNALTSNTIKLNIRN